ncbi:MAG: hypothetical protein NT062_08305 [Proteobacteria bacterium]|nr:hypothetical protein [Pseudomonadota bacterium]
MRLAALVLGLSLVGCAAPGDDAPTTVPTRPGKADSSDFTVSGARGWYLAGDGLTADDRLALTITGPDRPVDLWMDDHYVGRARGAFDVDLAGVAIGAHDVLLAEVGATVAFAEVEFQRSAPLYVVVSNDWDDPDNADPMLERQERLHARHPALKITHFVGPYTFTDPNVTPARAQRLVDWVTDMRDTHGDEIGLHVHPRCSFVEAAGLTCRTARSFAYANGDPTGYTVYLGSYTQPELETMFAKADELFVAHGLGKPTSFRAGGWTAELHVMKALEAAGHVADSSGCNWAKLEEWEHHAGASLFQWNAEHWAPIDATSQPYYPQTTDLLADAAPHMDILEVPDNGALVDYVSGDEMIGMFRENFPRGAALAHSTMYSIGYHPPNFSEAYFARIDQALTEIDRHLAVDGRGPVVYARMSDFPKAWAK